MARQNRPAAKSKSKHTSSSALAIDEFSRRVKVVGEDTHKTPADLLRAAGFASPLLVEFTEDIRARRFINWICEFIGSHLQQPAEVHSTNAATLSSTNALEKLLVRVQTPSLFSPSSIEVIWATEQLKVDALAEFLPTLSRPTLSSLIILTWNTSSKSITKDVAAFPGTHLAIPPLDQATLKLWIRKEVARLGHAAGIQPDAIELLSAVFPGDLSTLSQELEKAVLAVDSSKAISLSLVESLLSASPEHTGFELLRAIAQRNVPQALTLCESLALQGQHPLQLSAFLQRAFRIMLFNHDSHERDASAAPGDLQHPWLKRQLQPFARLFSAAELRLGIHELSKLDLRLRGSRVTPALESTLCIEHLATRQFQDSHASH